MSTIRFEWDSKKAQANLRKHKVSFEDAQSVFSDERALLIDDPDHSEDEERFVLLGLSQSLLLMDPATASWRNEKLIALVVAHEFAHMWFGNLVTMCWWDDLWLNEGFATWMQATAADAAFPGFFGAEDRVGDKNVAMNFDVLASAKAVRPTRSRQRATVASRSAAGRPAASHAVTESTALPETERLLALRPFS